MTSRSNYWDRVAHEKRFSHPLRTNWLARHLNSKSRILDYGCGYGRTLTELSNAGYENVVGMDFSESMLTRCRVELPFSKVLRNDGCGLPLKAGSFEAVLLFAVLTCVPDGDEQRRLILEIEHVLRPGGIIYLSDLLVNDDARNRERYQRFAEGYKCYGVFELPEGVVVRHHEKEWIEEIMIPFQQLEFEPFIVTTMNGNESAAFQYLGRKSISVANEVSTTPR